MWRLSSAQRFRPYALVLPPRHSNVPAHSQCRSSGLEAAVPPFPGRGRFDASRAATTGCAAGTRTRPNSSPAGSPLRVWGSGIEEPKVTGPASLGRGGRKSHARRAWPPATTADESGGVACPGKLGSHWLGRASPYAATPEFTCQCPGGRALFVPSTQLDRFRSTHSGVLEITRGTLALLQLARGARLARRAARRGGTQQIGPPRALVHLGSRGRGPQKRWPPGCAHAARGRR